MVVRSMRIFVILLTGALFTVGPTLADSTFDAAMSAYRNYDFAKAAELFRIAALHGNALAQNNLGVMYEKGEGVPQDDKEAVRWFRLAAEQGNAQAQLHLGNQYARGYGVARDNQEAVKWFRLAAEQGNATAQRNLGLSYLYGEVTPQDFIKAYAWLTVAEANGDEKAGDIIELFIDRMAPAELYIAQELAARYDAQTGR